MSTDQDPAGGRTKGHAVVETFDHVGVTLLPGRLRTQVERAREVYGGLADDDILKGFRRAAGLPAPGNDMRGWCARSSSVIFGQLLSGLTRLGRATGDDALIQKAIRLFEGWRATLPADGDVRMRLYDFDKLVCGLVDLHSYAGVDSALAVVEQTTRWAARTFDRTRRPADGHDFWGAGPGDTQEWYTLPENLYRAHLAGADGSVKEFADLWRYEAFWRPFAASAEPKVVLPVHAYSHVNSFSSAAMAYAVDGDRRHLDICRNAYDFMVGSQCYATGGYGPDERLMPPDGSLGRALDLLGGHAEIPCGSWAALKLSRYLMRFTGAARHGDWIETLVYNAMLPALPTEPDGRTYYYGDYRISSGIKQYYWHEWPCCSGTYLQTVADYHDIIYLHDAAGLYVNLLVPSEVTWSHQGTSVHLRQTTDYPETETSELFLDLERPTTLALHVRVPGWSDGLSLSVDGSAETTTGEPGQWATIEREWQPGDRVTVRVPMTLRTVPVDPQHPLRVAVMYGPLVLAQDEACCRRPFAMRPAAELANRLVREGPELRFRILNTIPERHTRFLQPLYTFPGFWPYWVYFDLRAPALY